VFFGSLGLKPQGPMTTTGRCSSRDRGAVGGIIL
jgi:hypothetical protein